MITRSIWVAAVLAVMTALNPATAQFDWSRVTTSAAPSARYGTAMAFNSASGDAVLFGGENSIGTRLQDSWTYNGTNWTLVATTSQPSGRTYASLSYDSPRNNAVLFGGLLSGSISSETWTFDGLDWTLRSPTSSPSARYGHATAFDAAHGALILFGGIDSGVTMLNDTWRWDGTAWTQLSPVSVPPPRYQHAMAYDSSRQVVVLFGGYNGPTTFSDTWEWDGSNWTQRTPLNSPSGLHHHQMAYDAHSGKVVLYGGLATSITDQTWTWDGSDWTLVTPATNPGPREAFGLAYDSNRKKTVLFGGDNSSAPFLYDETWELAFTPSPTAIPSPTSTITVTPTLPQPTPTATATITPTDTEAPTSTVLPTATETSVSSATPIPVSSPTVEPFPTIPKCLSMSDLDFYEKKALTLVVSFQSQAELEELSERLSALIELPSCNDISSRGTNGPHEGTIIAVAKADASGTFRFTVPDGRYTVRLIAPDVVLEPRTVTVSTDEPHAVQEYRTIPLDLHDSGCDRKKNFSVVTGVVKVAEAHATYSLKLYAEYVKAVRKLKGGKKAAAVLRRVSVKIQNARSQILTAAIALPSLQLSCHKKPTCTTVSFQSQVRSLTSSFKALDKDTVTLAKTAHSFLPRLTVSPVEKKSGAMYRKALKGSRRLPVRTDVCTG